MGRKPIIRSNEHYYHLVARSNNKENFYLPLTEMWKISCRKLRQLQEEYDIKIGAFMLMNNHFHLLLLTPKEDIDRIMYFFMKDITKEVQRKTKRINRIFGGRYKGSLIENRLYLMNVYRYIYQNPLRAGICLRAQDYDFNTLRPTGLQGLVLEKLFENLDENVHLEWLNAIPMESENLSIKSGLKKSLFAFVKDRSTGRSIVPKF